LEDANEALIEVFDEMDGQLDKEMSRIEELRRVRRENPGQLIETVYTIEAE
jgi:elongator complex protein 1